MYVLLRVYVYGQLFVILLWGLCRVGFLKRICMYVSVRGRYREDVALVKLLIKNGPFGVGFGVGLDGGIIEKNKRFLTAKTQLNKS